MTNQEQATSEDVQPKAKRNYVADHARRTLRAAGLSKKDARRVVEEIAKHDTFDLSKFSRNLPESASVILCTGFMWEYTPEGVKYWAEVEYAQSKREQAKEVAAYA